jgi:hypothetical protein
LPAVAISLIIVLPLEYASVRSALVNPLANTGWFPSLLDLPNDPLYRGLSRLEPGVVTVRSEQGELIAALSPHFLMADPGFPGSADFVQRQEGVADNRRILTFAGSPEEMQALLAKYHCRYVIVARGSPALADFKKHPELFDEALTTGTDVVFAVKNYSRQS